MLSVSFAVKSFFKDDAKNSEKIERRSLGADSQRNLKDNLIIERAR